MTAEERVLLRMFAHSPLPDAGFSKRVVRRLRRRLLLQRLVLPCAAIFGALIAIRPASDLLEIATPRLTSMLMAPDLVLFQSSAFAGNVLMGTALLGTIALTVRLLED